MVIESPANLPNFWLMFFIGMVALVSHRHMTRKTALIWQIVFIFCAVFAFALGAGK